MQCKYARLCRGVKRGFDISWTRMVLPCLRQLCWAQPPVRCTGARGRCAPMGKKGLPARGWAFQTKASACSCWRACVRQARLRRPFSGAPACRACGGALLALPCWLCSGCCALPWVRHAAKKAGGAALQVLQVLCSVRPQNWCSACAAFSPVHP